jgi:hypothetical protein
MFHPDELVDEGAREAFKATAKLCDRAGWSRIAAHQNRFQSDRPIYGGYCLPIVPEL